MTASNNKVVITHQEEFLYNICRNDGPDSEFDKQYSGIITETHYDNNTSNITVTDDCYIDDITVAEEYYVQYFKNVWGIDGVISMTYNLDDYIVRYEFNKTYNMTTESDQFNADLELFTRVLKRMADIDDNIGHLMEMITPSIDCDINDLAHYCKKYFIAQ